MRTASLGAAFLALTLCGISACSLRESSAPSIFQKDIPYLAPARTQRINDVTVHTFSNGMTLIHRENRTTPILGTVAYVRVGASEESDAENGVANLMMRVISKGTRKRNSDQIADELGLLGASLAPSAGQDFCRMSIQCVSTDAADAMEIFSDILLNPTFPTDQVEVEKRRVIAAIRMSEDQNSSVVSKRFARELFNTHPYSRPIEGTLETVPNINGAMLTNMHRLTFIPSNITISMVGDISFDEAKSLVEKYLAMEPTPIPERFEANKIIAPPGSRHEISKPAEQGFIMLGHLTCPSGHEDQPALEVASAVLGSGMSSRLFTELRDKRGLAYSVGSSTVFHQKQGYFYTFIGTSAETLDESEDGLWAEVRRLREAPVSEDELRRAKTYIGGQYLRNHERNLQQASYLAFWYVTGRGVEYDTRYLEEIEAVTTRDVMRVANKYFLDPTTVMLRPAGNESRVESTRRREQEQLR